jgi:folate-dependent phosphoribosylglycinamide formyltransferase PurN
MTIQTTTFRQIGDVIRDMLGGDYDDLTFLDTLDGETDVNDVIDRVLSDRAKALALSAAAKAQADDLAGRAKRIAERAKACDKALLDILDAIDLRKVERPAATVFRRPGSLRVQISDESSVPTQLCRIKREPDKAAIKRALEAGEDVPGASLCRGDDGVTVRVR